MKKVYIVIGPPGCGKGTQAVLLKDALNVGHISVGELLRDEIEHHTKLGHRIEDIISKGDMVPNSVVEKLLLQRVQQDDCKNGFILDGFPRTLDQVKLLEKVMRSVGGRIEFVIDYVVPDVESIKRVKGRAEKQKSLGEEVRADDLDEDIIKHRFKVYHEKTEPIISYFKQTGKLVKIDAIKSVNEILQSTLEKIR